MRTNNPPEDTGEPLKFDHTPEPTEGYWLDLKIELNADSEEDARKTAEWLLDDIFSHGAVLTMTGGLRDRP